MKYIPTLFLLVFFTACGTSESTDSKETTKAETTPTNEYEGYVQHNLSLIDYTASIQVPGSELTGKKPELFTDDFGRVNVQAGKRFHIVISDNEANLDQKKSELSNDIFYKTSFIKEQDDLLVYEQSLPDGSQKQFHFIQSIPVDGGKITVCSEPKGKFKESHIDRMLKSAKSIEAKSLIAQQNQ